jgi:hypothetical protein
MNAPARAEDARSSAFVDVLPGGGSVLVVDESAAPFVPYVLAFDDPASPAGGCPLNRMLLLLTRPLPSDVDGCGAEAEEESSVCPLFGLGAGAGVPDATAIPLRALRNDPRLPGGLEDDPPFVGGRPPNRARILCANADEGTPDPISA